LNIAQPKQSETLLTGQKRVLEMIAEGRPLGETLDALLRVIEAESPGMPCSILLLDDDGVHVRHGAAPSLPEGYIHAIDGSAIGPRAGSCGTAAFRREQVIVEDIMTDPLWEDYRDLAAKHGLRACWSTPIFDAQRRVLGTFAFYFHSPARPTQHHMQLIETATHIAAIAIGTQRKEEALRQSEKLFRSAMEYSAIGMALVAPDGKWLEVNRAVCQITGYSREELLAINFQIITHPEDLDTEISQMHRMLRGETVTNQMEKRYIHKDGHIVWILLTVALVRDNLEKPLYFIAQIQDITGRKQAEKTLQENERKYRELVENANSIIMRWRCNGHITFINEFGQKFFGYAEDELVGRHVVGTIVPETESTGRDLRPLMREICRNPKEFESNVNENVRRSGERVWIAWTNKIVFDDTGQVKEILSIGSDITEKKLANEKLAGTEARFRHLLNSSPSAIYATTLESRKCTYISETIIRLTGHEPQAVLDDPKFWFDNVQPDDFQRIKSELERHIKEGGGQLEYRFRKKNGEYIWVRDSFRVIWDANKVPFEVVGSWTDITASRQVEEQLVQSQKMEAVGQMTGGIAHDFNNRLTVIMGNLELLQRRLGNDQAAANQLKSILSAAEGAADLTRQLLAFSRRQAMETTVVNVNELVVNLRDMLQRTLGEMVKVEVHPGPDLWSVRTDRSLLENVLINLGVNARDAMPKGGKLIIETANTALKDTYSLIHGKEISGDFILLTVSDTGTGMTEEVKQRIFEPFFTTKAKGKGTGLGMSMVYGFVKQSGGHIDIHTELGHGTSFKIYLPKDSSAENTMSIIER